MKFYTFRQEQWIPRPLDEVFAFFSEARNLETLTPSFLNFKILSVSDKALKAGSVIRYRLRLHGLPVGWTTVIRKWEPPFRFVDIQTSGPYKLWHHTHKFESRGGQTRMTDVVRYKLPFGILGRLVHAITVRSEVQRIFEYRRDQIDKMFGVISSTK